MMFDSLFDYGWWFNEFGIISFVWMLMFGEVMEIL